MSTPQELVAALRKEAIGCNVGGQSLGPLTDAALAYLQNILSQSADHIEIAQKQAVEFDARLMDYFGNGGLFNPEMMEHDKVRTLLMDLHEFVRKLK